MTPTEQLERLLLQRSVQRGEFTLSSGLKFTPVLEGGGPMRAGLQLLQPGDDLPASA